ncbi:hypothetical protein GOP47_0017723 [Adiantum capillus-veneris]|uniref:Uncharacterized protein n=1 Tax=Adiantum capillus-veneris TaxID=13818 RepID=A0A9D4ZB36_ADICA|nr:hypothetical protein GOP47_0017723 [Adiantum capillus-veneris]
MSEVHVGESNNTSAQKKKLRGPGARNSVNGGAAVGSTNKQNNVRQTWPTQQAAGAYAEDEEHLEAEEGALQQQAASGPALSALPLDSSESVSAGLTEIVSGVLKQTEVVMEELLPMINEIDSSAMDIKDQINHKRDLAVERRAGLEQTRDRFQQAASSVLEMLGLTAPMLVESGETGT